MWPFKKKQQYLNKTEQDKVVASIQRAEANTTGELRVFIEGACTYIDAMDRAKELFGELGMTETVRRNGVLIYVAVDSHQYAILGDKEIYEQAGGPAFWQKAADELKAYLQKGAIGDGLCVCIDELGAALAKYFPYDPEVTKNELPDEIVFGK